MVQGRRLKKGPDSELTSIGNYANGGNKKVYNDNHTDTSYLKLVQVQMNTANRKTS